MESYGIMVDTTKLLQVIPAKRPIEPSRKISKYGTQPTIIHNLIRMYTSHRLMSMHVKLLSYWSSKLPDTTAIYSVSYRDHTQALPLYHAYEAHTFVKLVMLLLSHVQSFSKITGIP